jgi:hypothetical protein
MKEYIHYTPRSRKNEIFDNLSFPELEIEIKKQEKIEKELENSLQELGFTGSEQELIQKLEDLKQREEDLSCNSEVLSDDDMVRFDCERIKNDKEYYILIQEKRKELEQVKKTLFNIRETIKKRIDNN